MTLIDDIAWREQFIELEKQLAKANSNILLYRKGLSKAIDVIGDMWEASTLEDANKIAEKYFEEC